MDVPVIRYIIDGNLPGRTLEVDEREIFKIIERKGTIIEHRLDSC